MIDGMDLNETPRVKDRPVQLTLLPRPEVPVRFRLSAETRERGLRHAAEIRAMIAAHRAA
jgi:hypothetical protein